MITFYLNLLETENDKKTFEKLYNASEGSAKGEIYGLNHLSYFKSITMNGREILDELIENLFGIIIFTVLEVSE